MNPNPFEDYVKRERRYQRIAAELMRGADPHFNIAPVIDLVRMADGYGLDLVKRQSSSAGDTHDGEGHR